MCSCSSLLITTTGACVDADYVLCAGVTTEERGPLKAACLCYNTHSSHCASAGVISASDRKQPGLSCRGQTWVSTLVSQQRGVVRVGQSARESRRGMSDASVWVRLFNEPTSSRKQHPRAKAQVASQSSSRKQSGKGSYKLASAVSMLP